MCHVRRLTYAALRDHRGNPTGRRARLRTLLSARGIRRSGRTALYWVHSPMNLADVIDPETKSRGATPLGMRSPWTRLPGCGVRWPGSTGLD